jgi:hypothetical protein
MVAGYEDDERSRTEEVLAWTDGLLHWHAGCIELAEDDVEFRGLYDPAQWGEGLVCDTCGGPLHLPPREY